MTRPEGSWAEKLHKAGDIWAAPALNGRHRAGEHEGRGGQGGWDPRPGSLQDSLALP